MVTALPIVQRELLVRSRSRATWWIRTIVAATGCVVAFLMVLVAAGSNDSKVGLTLHVILGSLAWLFCLAEGVRHTVDCLSEEKRTGTLGLLFLTDLRGYDVVLGKFSAAGLTSFCGLLGLLPPLAVPITLGGVTGVEFWRLALALLNTLYFSLSVGTFISAFSRQELRGVSWATLWVLIFAGGPAVLRGLLPALPPLPSPWMVFFHSFAAQFDPHLFWISNLQLFALSSILLAIVSFALPRLWQDRAVKSRPARIATGADPSVAETIRRRRAGWLALNPIQWLVLRDEYERPWLWVLACMASAGAVGVWLLHPGDWNWAGAVFVGLQFVHFFVNCWVASAATRTLAEARQTGALELILSTPLPSRQIVRGLRLALRRMFVGPVLVLLITEVLLLVVQLALTFSNSGGGQAAVFGTMIMVTSIAAFILDLLAVANLGMWLGLTQRSATAALFRTILYALVLPLPLTVCSCVGPWLMLSKSIVIFTWAHGELHTQFRRVVTDRRSEPDQWKPSA